MRVEDQQQGLRRIFFKSIMEARDLLRKSGIFQLRIQKKATNKSAFLNKLRNHIR